MSLATVIKALITNKVKTLPTIMLQIPAQNCSLTEFLTNKHLNRTGSLIYKISHYEFTYTFGGTKIIYALWGAELLQQRYRHYRPSIITFVSILTEAKTK